MNSELERLGSSTDSAVKERLLIVDDDVKFCRLISDYLSRYGYEVTLVHDGLAALQIAQSATWDAIVLDVMLPGLEGYGVLKKLREQTQVPILMLTALGDETDRIVGLELGADDYLPKTFSPRELVARLRAVLRRSNRPLTTNTSGSDGEIVVGPLMINTASRMVTKDGELILLTPVEFDLLVVLANAKGRIKTREQLLNEIRDRHFDIYDRSIDVHVSALRKKLQDDPKNPRFIRTIRSAGYMLINPVEGSS
ncbi:MAG TPA: response regulator transcription factor [Oculatellaceae cyanobacterium]